MPETSTPRQTDTLPVMEAFYTIQGEGYHQGKAAYFIRLGGCNLACDFCDTEFERFAPMAVAEIVARAREEALPLAVITGGEPLRQNIAPLCEALLHAGMQVQIETNGTLWRSLPEAVQVVVR